MLGLFECTNVLHLILNFNVFKFFLTTSFLLPAKKVSTLRAV